MRYTTCLPLACLVVLFVLTQVRAAPPRGLETDWSSDPVWYDGLAEQADYEATRVIYGQPRSYTARLFTNKERYDPDTTTKAAGGDGVEVFKFHQRHDAPTKNYTYHFSTMSYVRSADLASVKLEMASQEDCGATFKRFVYDGETIKWFQSSYFPNEGLKTGAVDTPDAFVYADALPLVLRGYPFDEPREVVLNVMPVQTDTHLTPVRPVPMVVKLVETKTMDLPAGQIETHVLSLSPVQKQDRIDGGDTPMLLGFAANGEASADKPGLHVMVYLKSSEGVELKLKSQRRWAYWAN